MKERHKERELESEPGAGTWKVETIIMMMKMKDWVI